MRANQFITGYVGQTVKVESKFTDYELAVMEGGLSLDKPKSALHQAVTEDSGDSFQTIIQSFVASPVGQKYKQYDCKTVTRAFVQWAEQNKIPTQVVSLAPPSADFIAKNPRYKGKSGQGDGHIMPVVNGNAIDFTVRQFGINRPFENPLITPTSSLPAVYGKFGYFTDKPEWFLGGKSHWIGALNAIPPAIFNQNFGDEMLEHIMAEGLDEDAVRAEAQAAYMQGQCMILAVSINQLNPKRYPIGYIWEYNADAGVPDMQLDDDEWENLSPQEQEEISKNISRHSIVHAYVRDKETNEYIDARGRHRDIPNLWGRFGVTRFEEFPGTARELIDITVHGEWDEVGEQVNFKRGQPAFDSLAGPAGVKRAQDYAVKYLNIDPGPASQSTPKKSNWMNPGDPLPPSSPNSDWVILGPYKNVLYRFSAPNEQRANAMKDQWCKENNIDSDSNRFCRLKYDGEVRLGQPIKPRAVAENFADGRVKGKSSPGRVKRSGASCDGSVTDLRSKAKNASGERAKMYHWCANMKSGRADESGMLEGLNALWKDILEAGVFKGYPCTKDCSGHAAGYRWSDDRDITDPNLCPYSNNSFWEGCLAHTDEQE